MRRANYVHAPQIVLCLNSTDVLLHQPESSDRHLQHLFVAQSVEGNDATEQVAEINYEGLTSVGLGTFPESPSLPALVDSSFGAAKLSTKSTSAVRRVIDTFTSSS